MGSSRSVFSFEGPDSGFQSNMRAGFGIERQCKKYGMPKITIGITGWKENLGHDDGIKEPYWGPSR